MPIVTTFNTKKRFEQKRRATKEQDDRLRAIVEESIERLVERARVRAYRVRKPEREG